MDYTDTSLSTATIKINKLFQNITNLKKLLVDDTHFMAVVKADAYSHGAVPLAREMEATHAVDYFGVSQLKEALELRAAGIETPILIFNSVRPHEVQQAIEHDVTMTVFAPDVAQEIVQMAESLEKTAKVHLKIDTGMARLGVATFAEANEIYSTLQSTHVHVEGIYTHFADAPQEYDEKFTHEQFERFNNILDEFSVADVHFDLRHCCNTAATINFPEYHLDMVRIGIGLYGFNPAIYNKEKIELTPIETIETTVTHVKDFPAGESVGYTRTYFSSQPMRIATVAIGYADGVSKALSNKGYFTYQDYRLPIIGEVCMDQIMLDVTDVQELAIGNQVIYFGDPAEGNISVEEVAEFTGESEYDLLCRMSCRVERIYHKNEG